MSGGDRITVEAFEDPGRDPSVIITEESDDSIRWQRALSVRDASALHRALGVALSEVDS